MVNDAETFKDEDDKQKERITVKNTLNPIYSTLKQVWTLKRSSQNLHQMNFPQPSLHLMQLSSGWMPISWRRRKSLRINKRSWSNVKTFDDQNLWSRNPIMWRT